MRSVDVLIVGGGPAGSSAARRLVRGGASVLVLDKETFPRLKLCAGWITPEVVRDLDMDIKDYPHRFLTFERLHVHVKGLYVKVPCIQHSIRRVEFDAWLLERSGAPVVQHTVKTIREEDGWYVVDDAFRARHIIGAGGTRCPVYRTLFREANPRAAELQTVTLEHEIPYGYSWYVPTENGWLNVGVGGMAERLKRSGKDIRFHWSHFTGLLDRKLATGAQYDPHGYSYYLRGNVDVVRIGNAYVAGDAAGLATRDMAEGIGPAVRSGNLAADAILKGADYNLQNVTGASLGGGLVTRMFDWAMTRGA
jgi:flavin-dependent dehydrogenase